MFAVIHTAVLFFSLLASESTAGVGSFQCEVSKMTGKISSSPSYKCDGNAFSCEYICNCDPTAKLKMSCPPREEPNPWPTACSRVHFERVLYRTSARCGSGDYAKCYEKSALDTVAYMCQAKCEGYADTLKNPTEMVCSIPQSDDPVPPPTNPPSVPGPGPAPG